MTDNTPAWLSYLAAFGAITTPILVAVLGGIGWKIRSKIERQLSLEQKLREDRISIYNEILEPFMVMLMSDEAWKADPRNKNRDKIALGARQILSLDYRKCAFRLALVGSDGVVKAYNELMQYFFSSDGREANEATVTAMLSRIGQLLLQIRRSMGNEDTDLDRWAMLEWFINDARRYRSNEA
jgi:hypothetical protein